MALLDYNEIREGKVIIYKDEPCVVLESHVARTQQRKPQNQVKLKSLLNGRTFNDSFRSSDTADEAELRKQEVKFLYESKGEYWFCDAKDPSKRFALGDDVISANTKKFLIDNTVATALVFETEDDEEKIIGVTLPIKMTFEIKDAPPSIKGNSVSGGNKQLTLANGTVINGPLFLEAGEKIIVNTETGEYVERASK